MEPFIANEEQRIVCERMMYQAIERRRRELGLTIDELSRRVYPHASRASASMNYIRMHKPQYSTGKPKRLLIGEFIAYCQALELCPERVVARVMYELEKDNGQSS